MDIELCDVGFLKNIFPVKGGKNGFEKRRGNDIVVKNRLKVLSIDPGEAKKSFVKCDQERILTEVPLMPYTSVNIKIPHCFQLF